MKLFIMVGVPGSGKSTLARELAKEHKAVILSTDAIFEAPLGGSEGALLYLWSRNCIKQAHLVNQTKCQVAMALKINIIIDNTNLTKWERSPYIDLAETYNYDVEVVEPDTPWKDNTEECFKRTTHSVPLETIKAMLDRKEV